MLPVALIKAKDRKEAAEKLLLINSRYAKIDQDGFDFFVQDFDIDVADMSGLLEIPEIDFGIEDEEFEGNTDPDDIPEVEETSVTKMGDIWLLGDHRLCCGDSTKIEDVEKLINGEKARICVTSPPYANQRDYSIWETYEDYLKFSNDIIINIKNILMPDSIVFWNIGSSEPTNNFIPADHYFLFLKNKFKWIEWIIWNKESATWTIPRSQHIENGLYIPALRWESMIVFSNGKRPKFDISDKSEIRQNWQDNVWNLNKVIGSQQKKIGHTALYPVEIPYRAIKSYTLKNEICFEPFSGGGTTIIAAEKTGRKCYAIEIDPQYVQVAIKRWQDFTGENAILESTGQTFTQVSEINCKTCT